MLGYGIPWAFRASRLKSEAFTYIERRVGACTHCRQSMENQGVKTTRGRGNNLLHEDDLVKCSSKTSCLCLGTNSI